MDIGFLITTYNRQEACRGLIDSLQGLGDIVVLNDGADYNISGAKEIRQAYNLGKCGYWKTVNNLFRFRGQHKYYIMLPDDFRLLPNAVPEIIRLWHEIDDPKKICLNLLTNRTGVACWTNFKPVDKGNVWQTQWVDMCFMCEERFFTTVGVIPELWRGYKKVTNRSSGVGAYISRRLHNRHYGLYQVKEPFAVPIEEHMVSQMHR